MNPQIKTLLSPLSAYEDGEELIIPLLLPNANNTARVRKELGYYRISIEGASSVIIDIDSVMDEASDPKDVAVWVCNTLYDFFDSLLDGMLKTSIIINDWNTFNTMENKIGDLLGDLHNLSINLGGEEE